MMWFLLWIVVSIPAALLIASFCNYQHHASRLLDRVGDLDAEWHDQTLVG